MGRKEFRKSRPALNLLPSWYLLLSAPPTRRTAPPPTGHQQLARVVKVPLSICVVLRKNTVSTPKGPSRRPTGKRSLRCRPVSLASTRLLAFRVMYSRPPRASRQRTETLGGATF